MKTLLYGIIITLLLSAPAAQAQLKSELAKTNSSSDFSYSVLAQAQKNAAAKEKQKNAAAEAASTYKAKLRAHANGILLGIFESMSQNGVKMMDIFDVEAPVTQRSVDEQCNNPIKPSHKSPQFGEVISCADIFGFGYGNPLGAIFQPVGAYQPLQIIITSDSPDRRGLCDVEINGAGQNDHEINKMPCDKYLAGDYDTKIIALFNKVVQEDFHVPCSVQDGADDGCGS